MPVKTRLRSVILWPFEAQAAHAGTLGVILRPALPTEASRQSNAMKVGYLSVQAGDHLAVREQWRPVEDGEQGWLETATGDRAVIRWDRGTDECYCEPAGDRVPKLEESVGLFHERNGFRPAREMPTWATQKWLEVLAVDILPLSSLSSEDWSAVGLGDSPATLATLLSLHQQPVTRYWSPQDADKFRDSDAYASWLERGADPWVSRIRVRRLPVGAYAWYIDGRKWERQESPNPEPYGTGRF